MYPRTGFLFAFGGQRGKDAGDTDGCQAGIGDAAGRFADGGGIERNDRAAVIFVAALHHVDLPADNGRKVIGPVDEGRQAGAGGEADAQRADFLQSAALDHRVGEMGGADDDGGDAAGIALGQQLRQGSAHAA